MRENTREFTGNPLFSLRRGVVLAVLRMRARGRRGYPNAAEVPLDSTTIGLLRDRGIEREELDEHLNALDREGAIRLRLQGAVILATLRRGVA
jgi:hypothetical protein